MNLGRIYGPLPSVPMAERPMQVFTGLPGGVWVRPSHEHISHGRRTFDQSASTATRSWVVIPHSVVPDLSSPRWHVSDPRSDPEP